MAVLDDPRTYGRTRLSFADTNDIDEFDARLPEFPGRIRRDAWVTQSRELHYTKYGERP